uniref:Uncharacterized protein n=1 Tax=Rhizophora mucronata TaxID=61149 RepID=A0A2P2Q6Y0_RHIMU
MNSQDDQINFEMTINIRYSDRITQFSHNK